MQERDDEDSKEQARTTAEVRHPHPTCTRLQTIE